MYLEGENVNPPSVLPDELLERMLATIASPFPDQGAEANASVHQAVRTFVPSREALRTAVDSVFWAMQSREEARPAITRVAFQFMRDPACAVEATDLSVAELTKLSPIMDLPASWLVVGEEGKIVGVAPRAHYACSVAGTARGQLVVSIGERVLALLEEGRWRWINGDRMSVEMVLAKVFSDGEFPDKMIRGSLVLNLAIHARNAGRGASFVFVEGANTSGISWPPKYPVGRFQAAEEGIALWNEWRADPFPADHFSLHEHEIRRGKEEGSRRLRSLAATLLAAVGGIDGSTVISIPSMALLGFGAKIDVPDDDVSVHVLELPPDGSKARHGSVVTKKRDLGGTRHQSAARLVQSNHDASVVTVSQDGRISMFAWASGDEAVVVVRGIDRYIAAEENHGSLR